MWDGSAVSLTENLQISKDLLAQTKNLGIILEVEIGVVGGEEDGVEGGEGDHLYSTIEDGLLTAEALGLGENGRYLTALTFGNVHGVYKAGNVVLRPELLNDIQRAVGGSGSTPQEIADAVRFGVVKMNIDTDTQYAFTRSIAGHMLSNYDKVLKIDGEVGDKKAYDPRAWGKVAEADMAKRVVLATQELGSASKSMSL
jgi:fructose-bisphosphate aldolase class II